MVITPDADQYGIAVITLTIPDGIDTPITSFALTVTPANDAPVMASIPDKAVDEGQTFSFTDTASDIDLPDIVLTFTLEVGAPAGANITPEGQFTYIRPGPRFVLLDCFYAFLPMIFLLIVETRSKSKTTRLASGL